MLAAMHAPQIGRLHGEGNRRGPGMNYTSAGRQRRPAWWKRAMHVVDESALKPPCVEICFVGPISKNLVEVVYLLDQEAAREQFWYAVRSAARRCWGYREYEFRIVVERTKAEAAQRAVTRIAPSPPVGPWRFGCEFWGDLLTPKSKGYAGWHVALYKEYASGRSDGRDYAAFLLRDEKRTQFGIQEFFGDDTAKSKSTWRELAFKVNHDARFRHELFSDDPDLPKMWRRH